jgi:hypothetical protein
MRGGFASERRRAPDRDRRVDIAIGDDGTRFGVLEDVRQLALAVEDVDRHEDHAELEARQE